MIRGTVIGDDRVNVNLEAMTGKIITAVEKRMQRVVKKIEASVKTDKLSGQVLHVRTGTLRRSIHSDVKSDGSQIVGTVGTNLIYAAYHEYGFNGTENVKEHMRQIKQAAILHTKGARAGTVNKAATAKQHGPAQMAKVRAHTRHVNYPAHSFLRTTLREQEQFAKNELSEGVKEGARS
jgi:phage gpG-like protein